MNISKNKNKNNKSNKKIKNINLIHNKCHKSISNKECFCFELENYNDKIVSIIKIQRFIKLFIYKHKRYMNELNNIITHNNYVINCKSNKKKDVDSLSSLINRNLSQSDCIKLGNGVEKVLNDIVLKYTNLKDIKPKNSKGKKEKDHLLRDEITKLFIMLN